MRYRVFGSFSFVLTLWPLSPRVIERTRKSRGNTPASRHPSVAPPHSHSASLLEQQELVQTKPLMPPAATGTPHPPDHKLIPLLEHDPVPHESLPPASADASEVVPEPYERLVERVREVVPDVLPAHVFDLLAERDTGIDNRDDLLNLVIHILLENRTYPKDIKGKGKATATAEKAAEISGDTINTSVDYTHPDPNRRLGRAYWNLSLVRTNFSLSITC